MSWVDGRGASSTMGTVTMVENGITVTIGAAFWMDNVMRLCVKFEKIEISRTYAKYGGSRDLWTVTVTVKSSDMAYTSSTLLP